MNIEKQARWWKYAAWTAPFVALAILIGEILLGFDNLIKLTTIAIVVLFITTSVFWWWWAISKLVDMVNVTERVIDNFNEIKTEIKEIKKDVGDRQWREPNSD
jgi:hypothetical protein